MLLDPSGGGASGSWNGQRSVATTAAAAAALSSCSPSSDACGDGGADPKRGAGVDETSGKGDDAARSRCVGRLSRGCSAAKLISAQRRCALPPPSCLCSCSTCRRLSSSSSCSIASACSAVRAGVRRGPSAASTSPLLLLLVVVMTCEDAAEELAASADCCVRSCSRLSSCSCCCCCCACCCCRRRARSCSRCKRCELVRSLCTSHARVRKLEFMSTGRGFLPPCTA